MKYNVTAQAFNRSTGAAVSEPRVETIDAATNQLFTGCNTPLEVKANYEAFWNDLNPRSEHIVFVQQVEPLK